MKADESPEPSLALPVAALVTAAVLGIAAIAYTVMSFDAIPDPMPTHFGLTGRPDGWSRKSIGATMVPPIMTLMMGVVLGGAALLTARAQLGSRPDGRAATSNFLAILGLLVTGMLASLSVGSVQVAIGSRQTLPRATLLLGLAIFLYAMIGAAWLAIRYGRRGARPETTRGHAPSMGGLEGNRHWKLGVFYVDPDDPSWLVEHRFGFGYTLNFGNPRAVATFAVFLGGTFALTIWAIVSSS